MLFSGRVYSVLIVSSSEKLNTVLKKLLPASDYGPVRVVTSIAAAKREVVERSYDFVVVNTPLVDDFGDSFAMDISNKKDVVVLMLIKKEIYEEVHYKVVDQGVYTLPKPVSTQIVEQALKWMASSRERLRRMEKKSTSMEDRMKEIRIVNHAKWLLIEKKQMTEAEAHRSIEKEAMDTGSTRRAIAERIIAELEG